MDEIAIDLQTKPEVEAFFDPRTNTISYVVKDPGSAACAVIDSVLDLDYAAGRISFESADRMIGFIEEKTLSLEWIIETHAHADHLSAAPYIQERLGGLIGIGQGICEVQEVFGKIFNEGTEFQRDGSQFDRLFQDGDRYKVGSMDCIALHTPGHTPACMVHIMGDAGFVGDTLFMPDGGSARADFPGGDAGILYDSIQRILSLPDQLRLFMCHDYGPNGREIAWETSVGAEKRDNIHVGGGRSREDFVTLRETRDAQLAVPALLLPAIQVNMRAGDVPKDEAGTPALKVPLNRI
ncbi:MAG: MBL fold metallo-hydrolase [Kiloniellales bacterium]